MAQRNRTFGQASRQLTPPHAAGIDIGSTSQYVAMPPDRDNEPTRKLASVTDDLQLLADGLTTCGVDTGAMESTSAHWMPLFELLDARGFTVLLANAWQQSDAEIEAQHQQRHINKGKQAKCKKRSKARNTAFDLLTWPTALSLPRWPAGFVITRCRSPSHPHPHALRFQGQCGSQSSDNSEVSDIAIGLPPWHSSELTHENPSNQVFIRSIYASCAKGSL